MSQGYWLRLMGDPILKRESVEVPSRDALDAKLITALKREARMHGGVGMAAQQVGGIQRICLATLADRMTVLINPVIVSRSSETVTHVGEGCLSVPGFRTSVKRAAAVTVAWVDEEFRPHRETLKGFDAQVVQHECDHLDGRCIVDGVSRQQRRVAERLLAKARD